MARTPHHQDTECPAAAYLRRQPENLVVNGYRNCVASLAHRDSRYWDAARSAHWQALGAADGAYALELMTSLIGRLGVCATCPLRFCRPGTGHLCRDECLVLGMVAGAQNGDEVTMVQSARLLSCSETCFDIIDRASTYAGVLLGHGQRLTPIPLDAIADIELRSAAYAGGPASGSVH
ncbi:hypothetical protein [Hoeflea olei]|uniref:Uncharacterized protein n=1 Tax=Hoeflea olei TaxID=1480615 RepID=A0A1C1YS98_9HYPH|nr:hypothetical protein [Hoeflea olei]OCW56227.1 hypothetical protein AWJ14_19220 [Hoeflea olei]